MLTTNFIISQILMLGATAIDYISMQQQTRKKIFLTLSLSPILISLHYYFLNQKLAALIVIFSTLRFLTCAYTTNKKYLIIFLTINTTIFLLNLTSYKEILLLFGLSIFIIGNFQKNKKTMRTQMILGTSTIIIYNTIIISPMATLTESIFLYSQLKNYKKSKL